MKILTCFKVVPDLDHVLEEDWGSFSYNTDFPYVRKQFSCFDESALEISLRLKKGLGDSGSCTALTIAKELPANFVKTLYAVGFDEVILLTCEQREFSPKFIGEEIAAYVEKAKYDIIITGEQANLGDHGATPFYIANKLKYPIITKVENLFIQDEALLAEMSDEEGNTQLTLSTPIVVSIGNSPITALRTATLMEQMKAGKKALIEKTIDKKASINEDVYFTPSSVKKLCQFIEGETFQTTALALKNLIDLGGENH